MKKKRIRPHLTRLTSTMRASGYLTASDAAKEAGVSRETIYLWARSGRLATRRAGVSSLFISRVDLRKLCPQVAS